MRYGVVLFAGLLIAVGSCYCDDAAAEESSVPAAEDTVSLLQEIEAASELDASEIDDDVLNALEELDQANDMNFSTTQKFWLGCIALYLEAREKALALKDTTATHMSDHKKEYLIGASAFAAGALAVILFQKLHAKSSAA